MTLSTSNKNLIITISKKSIEASLKSEPSLKDDKKKIVDKLSYYINQFSDTLVIHINDIEKEEIINLILDDLYIFSEESSILTSNEPFKWWYKDTKSESELYYWNKYSEFLSEQNGWTTAPGGNISCLDMDTDKTLTLCNNPND